MKNLLKNFAKLILMALPAYAPHLALGQTTGTAAQDININNISLRIMNVGDWGWDRVSSSKNEMPKGSGKHSIFAGALWLGGMEKGNLRMAAMTYRQNGSDFFPGPLDTSTGSIDSMESAKYDKIWKIKRTDLNDFRHGSAPATYDMLSWPGNPIDKVSAGQAFSHYMAPFYDANGNGIYDPSTDGKTSDYPLILGDEELWWVFNDKEGIHKETKGLALGVEVRARAYAYNCPNDTPLYNTVFFQYDIINRGGNNYDSFYIGNWTDFELGYAFDDYTGCDTLLNAFYAYNGSNYDSVYGKDLPAQAVVFLDRPMNNFVSYNNDFNGVNGNPDSVSHYYNYLTSRWKNGALIHDDHKNGTGSGTRTHFMFPGDPASTSKSEWTEKNAGNPPGDRRGIAASGPYQFKPGETKTISFAYVFSQKAGANGDNTFNVAQMKKDVKHIRDIFTKGSIASCSSTSGIAEDALDAKRLKIYPNPVTNEARLINTGASACSVRVINGLGQEVYSTWFAAMDEKALPLQNLAAGIYTIIVQNKDGFQSERLIKL
jgi:hypothetical protein